MAMAELADPTTTLGPKSNLRFHLHGKHQDFAVSLEMRLDFPIIQISSVLQEEALRVSIGLAEDRKCKILLVCQKAILYSIYSA